MDMPNLAKPFCGWSPHAPPKLPVLVTELRMNYVFLNLTDMQSACLVAACFVVVCVQNPLWTFPWKSFGQV
jgi:hypothetical protein